MPSKMEAKDGRGRSRRRKMMSRSGGDGAVRRRRGGSRSGGSSCTATEAGRRATSSDVERRKVEKETNLTF